MNKKSCGIIAICLIVVLLLTSKTIFKKEENQQGEQSGFVQEIASSEFENEVLNSDKKVLVDFYATWCGPCKIISPIIEEVAKENPEVKFVKVDIDANQELAEKYEVVYIPTLVVIENGKEITKSVGAISKEEILNLIKWETNRDIPFC
mgnify:FL=1